MPATCDLLTANYTLNQTSAYNVVLTEIWVPSNNSTRSY